MDQALDTAEVTELFAGGFAMRVPVLQCGLNMPQGCGCKNRSGTLSLTEASTYSPLALGNAAPYTHTFLGVAPVLSRSLSDVYLSSDLA